MRRLSERPDRMDYGKGQMNRTQQVIIVLQVIGRKLFTVGVLGILALIVGELASLSWVVSIGFWTCVLMWGMWVSDVAVSSILQERYRRKLASEFHR